MEPDDSRGFEGWGFSLIHLHVATASQKPPTFTMSFAPAGIPAGGLSLPGLRAGSCRRPQPSPGGPVSLHTQAVRPLPPPSRTPAGAASPGLTGVTRLAPRLRRRGPRRELSPPEDAPTLTQASGGCCCLGVKHLRRGDEGRGRGVIRGVVAG